MKFTRQIEIQAPVTTVWNIMRNVEKWCDWTPTITSIEKKGTQDFGVGTRLFIKQPKLPPAEWRIFEMETEKGFAMAKGNWLLKIIAGHRLQPGFNGTKVDLSLDFSGVFGNWVAKKYKVMMEEYLTIEAAGLKKESELPGT